MNSNNQSSSATYKKYLNEWLATSNNNNNNNINHINPNGGYQQKSLDGWLNAAMKNSPETFSMSSMLDGARVSASGSTEMPGNMNIEPSQYFPSHLHSTTNSLRMPNHSADFTSLPPGVNLNQESNKTGSQNDLLDGLENRR